MKRRNINYPLQEGLTEDDEEKLNGVKAKMFLLSGEGRNEEPSGQGQPEEPSGQGQPRQEATAAEGEGAGEGPSGAGAAWLTDVLNQKDQGASSGDQNEKQSNEPDPKDIGVTEGVQQVSVLVRQRCFHYKFSQWQLQELERFFRQNHYISPEVRKHLARWIGVTETRVQNWFKGRREQYRRDQRL